MFLNQGSQAAGFLPAWCLVFENFKKFAGFLKKFLSNFKGKCWFFKNFLNRFKGNASFCWFFEIKMLVFWNFDLGTLEYTLFKYFIFNNWLYLSQAANYMVLKTKFIINTSKNPKLIVFANKFQNFHKNS